jgi:hypothetical protein
MTNHRPFLHIVASKFGVVAMLSLVALCCGLAAGQSGRRAPKSSVPAPVPQATPEATPTPKETKSALSLVVGMDRGSAFAEIPTYFYDTVLSACGERLDNSPSAKADIAKLDMNRSEAVKRAKAETESYVVLLQLKFDNPRMQRIEDLREIYIEYTVFAPMTGKSITNGRTYQQMARAGGVIVMPAPGGRASLPYAEEMLKRAARDAADRILSVLSVSGRKIPS